MPFACTRSSPISRATVKLLDSLRPHFAHAALFSARLELQRVEAAAAALELVGLPAAILGSRARLVSANAPFAKLMPDVVQDRPTRCALADRRADSLLQVALDAMRIESTGTTNRSIPIPARGERPPIIVHVLPVQGMANDLFTSAIAILIATPVEPQKAPSADIVQGLFDLTPAEAKLAANVAAGHAPREAAAILGWREETARTVLKRVLGKTGLHRQADLVGLLSGAALPSPD